MEKSTSQKRATICLNSGSAVVFMERILHPPQSVLYVSDNGGCALTQIDLRLLNASRREMREMKRIPLKKKLISD